MSKARPLHDRVAVEVIKREETTKGGIVIPITANAELIQTGKVVAVGNGRVVRGTVIPVEVQVGDEVIFSLRSSRMATEVEIDGKKCLILEEQEILAAVETS